VKLAAIDIGSNAIRLQIVNAIQQTEGNIHFKKLEYIRCPLRLGREVFNSGYIPQDACEKFIKLMQAYKNLMELFEVEHYKACATSAMRESKNGAELVENTYQKTGIKIDIIDGQLEAHFINKAIVGTISSEETYLHIDVGGGSTELNVYKGKLKIASESFPLGSVRSISQQDSSTTWYLMRAWIIENVWQHQPVTAIGTGGNINKLAELIDKKKGNISIKKLKEIHHLLKNLTQEQRTHQLLLNEDRADVIVPAADIYMYVMEHAKCKNIIVPELGLKDGIIIELYETLNGLQ
jgi:exopolyphosphatase/guanosine-5'-triphosphate,3'-diphosphate pyrophosphatase